MSTIDNTDQTLIDIPTLAARLGSTERFVRGLVEQKRIKFVKVGKFVKFQPEDVAAWIDSRTVQQKNFD